MKINLTIISLLTILVSLAICQDASKVNYFKDNSQKYKKGNTFYRKEKKVLAAFPLFFYFAFLTS